MARPPRLGSAFSRRTRNCCQVPAAPSQRSDRNGAWPCREWLVAPAGAPSPRWLARRGREPVEDCAPPLHPGEPAARAELASALALASAPAQLELAGRGGPLACPGEPCVRPRRRAASRAERGGAQFRNGPRSGVSWMNRLRSAVPLRTWSALTFPPCLGHRRVRFPLPVRTASAPSAVPRLEGRRPLRAPRACR